MELRFYLDPEWEEPHIHRHNVDERDVEDILADPLEDRPGRDGAWVALGRTQSGRYVRVIYVPNERRTAAFVITAYPVSFNVVARCDGGAGESHDGIEASRGMG